MRHWTVIYEYKTRPWFHAGRVRRDKVAVVADDLAQAYRIAKKHCEWLGRKYQIIEAKEIK